MSIALGLDTSNYTTSTALYDRESAQVTQQKKLLPVAKGQLGLRQSDAVFHHIQQLPDLMTALFENAGSRPDVIGVSTRPRPVEGSYMPCFEVGRGAAQQLAAVLGVPLRTYSHQEGHIAAAMYSSGFRAQPGERFIAYHLSGGTTEGVLVTRHDDGFSVELLCGSLDLKAGQLIDRVAGMLGLPFPGGVHLEKLALSYDGDVRCKPTMKGAGCCLSGVENICQKLLAEGKSPEYVARVCIGHVCAAVTAMTEAIFDKYGELPLLFAGGVSSNVTLREEMQHRFGAYFAQPPFSCDNAAGIAILASGGECL